MCNEFRHFRNNFVRDNFNSWRSSTEEIKGLKKVNAGRLLETDWWHWTLWRHNVPIPLYHQSQLHLPLDFFLLLFNTFQPILISGLYFEGSCLLALWNKLVQFSPGLGHLYGLAKVYVKWTFWQRTFSLVYFLFIRTQNRSVNGCQCLDECSFIHKDHSCDDFQKGKSISMYSQTYIRSSQLWNEDIFHRIIYFW